MCVPDETEEAEPTPDSGTVPDSSDTGTTATTGDDTGLTEGPWEGGTISYSTAPPEAFLGGLIILAAPAEDENWPVGTHCTVTTPGSEELAGTTVGWGIPMAFLCPTPDEEPPVEVIGGHYMLRASLYASGQEMPLYCAEEVVTVDGDITWEFELIPC